MNVLKDIKGYEGYKISSEGYVVSTKGVVPRVLKNSKGSNGYLTVTLSNQGYQKTHLIHCLVANAFLNHVPNKKLVIDHINNQKCDNRLHNLQIISPRENTSKDRKIGTSKYIGVWFNRTAKKWVSEIQIKGIKKNLGSFDIEQEAAKAYQNALKILHENN